MSGQLSNVVQGVKNQYNKYELHDIRKFARGLSRPNNFTLFTKLKQLGILKYRGTRGGLRKFKPISEVNNGIKLNNLQLLPKHITTIVRPRRSEIVKHADINFYNHADINFYNQHFKTGKHNSSNLINIKYKAQNTVKGQKKLSVCSLNPRSVKNKTISLCDYIVSNDFDVVALTETWLRSTVDKTCIGELVPTGYSIKHVARSGKKRGGGVALIYKSAITLRIIASTRDNEFKNFEYMDCSLIINGFSLRLAVIYRPPPSQANGLKTSEFLEDE